MPQPGCNEARCASGPPRYVASLALETGDGVYLFDATPDLPRQVRLLPPRTGPGERTRSVVDGVFLTHAHMGHYLGLAHFGFESSHTDATPVWASERMRDFLRTNAPWDQLVALKEIDPRPIDEPVALSRTSVSAVTVPHRGEYTDTLAYRIAGPGKTALYVPDIDPWSRHPELATNLFKGVDIAYVDGTFFSAEELPGRDVQAIGHPLIVDTLALLEDRLEAQSLDLRFIHLNHTNAALDRVSRQRRLIEAAGAHVAERGEVVSLALG